MSHWDKALADHTFVDALVNEDKDKSDDAKDDVDQDGVGDNNIKDEASDEDAVIVTLGDGGVMDEDLLTDENKKHLLKEEDTDVPPQDPNNGPLHGDGSDSPGMIRGRLPTAANVYLPLTTAFRLVGTILAAPLEGMADMWEIDHRGRPTGRYVMKCIFFPNRIGQGGTLFPYWRIEVNFTIPKLLANIGCTDWEITFLFEHPEALDEFIRILKEEANICGIAGRSPARHDVVVVQYLPGMSLLPPFAPWQGEMVRFAPSEEGTTTTWFDDMLSRFPVPPRPVGRPQGGPPPSPDPTVPNPPPGGPYAAE